MHSHIQGDGVLAWIKERTGLTIQPQRFTVTARPRRGGRYQRGKQVRSAFGGPFRCPLSVLVQSVLNLFLR